MTTPLSQRAASFGFALVTTLSILSGVFTLAHHEELSAQQFIAQQAAVEQAS